MAEYNTAPLPGQGAVRGDPDPLWHIVQDPGIPDSAKIVYWILWKWAGMHPNELIVSKYDLAQQTGRDLRSVERNIQRLVDLNLVEVKDWDKRPRQRGRIWLYLRHPARETDEHVGPLDLQQRLAGFDVPAAAETASTVPDDARKVDGRIAGNCAVTQAHDCPELKEKPTQSKPTPGKNAQNCPESPDAPMNISIEGKSHSSNFNSSSVHRYRHWRQELAAAEAAGCFPRERLHAALIENIAHLVDLERDPENWDSTPNGAAKGELVDLQRAVVRDEQTHASIYGRVADSVLDYENVVQPLILADILVDIAGIRHSTKGFRKSAGAAFVDRAKKAFASIRRPWKEAEGVRP